MGRGGRKPRVTDEEILELFRESDDPVLSTAEVAEQIPIQRRGTLNRLQALVDEGRLEGKDIGGRNRVWWLPEVRIATSSVSDDRERTPERPPETRDSRPEEPPTEPWTVPDSSDTDISAALAVVEFPGGRDREEYVEVVLAARDYLREHGSATMRDFVRDVMPEHSLGYDVPDLDSGGRYRGAWWRRVVKPGLEALPDVRAPSPGQSAFRYVVE